MANSLNTAFFVALSGVQEWQVATAVRVNRVDCVANLLLAEQRVKFAIYEHQVNEIESLVRRE
jgi:hypothetical protein